MVSHKEPFTGVPRSSAALLASPDGARLLVYGGREALLLSVPDLRPLARLQVRGGAARSASWSADGRRLALSGPGGVEVFDALEGGRLLTLPELSGPTLLSPNGDRVAATGPGERLMITRVKGGPRLVVQLGVAAGRRASVNPAAWSPDGEQLALSCTGYGAEGIEHAVELRCARSGRLLANLSGERAPCWGEDLSLLTVAPEADEVRMRRGLGEGQGPARLNASPLGDARLDLRRARLAWAGVDGLLAWELRGYGGLRLLHPGAEPGPPSDGLPAVVDATPCGEGIVALLRADDRGVELRDAWTWERLAALGPAAELRHAALGPDGDWLLAAIDAEPRLLLTWSLSQDRALGRWPGAGPPLALSPDGATLAFTQSEECVSLWDARRARLLRTLRGHEGRIWELAWCPDGEHLASAGEDERVMTWNIRQDAPLHVLSEEDGEHVGAPTLCFSPELGLLAVQALRDEPEPPHVLNLYTGELRSLPEGAGALVSWLDDEQLLCLNPDEPGILESWSWEDGAVTDGCDVGGDGVVSVEVTAGRVAFASPGEQIGVWTPGGGEARLLDLEPEPASWTLAQDGSLAVLSRAEELSVWEPGQSEPRFRFDGVCAFAPAPVGGGYWIAGRGHLIELSAGGGPERSLEGPAEHAPLGVSVSMDGRRVCTWDRRSVLIWSAEAPPRRLFLSAEGGLVEASALEGPVVEVRARPGWADLHLLD